TQNGRKQTPPTPRGPQTFIFQAIPRRDRSLSWIASAVCSVCHTGHADTRLALTSGDLASRRSRTWTSSATRGEKAHFCDRHHIASATAALSLAFVDWRRMCGGHIRCFLRISAPLTRG